MKIKVFPGVYPPSEDTFFLAEWLDRNEVRRKRVLDMGSGSGYLGILAALKGARVVAADINPGAVLNTRYNARTNRVHIQTVLSDLFENVPGRFDVILFNPPYLTPWEEISDLSWDGGWPIVKRFIEEVRDHLTDEGVFLFVMEEDENWRRIKDILEEGCFKVKKNAFHLVRVVGRPCP